MTIQQIKRDVLKLQIGIWNQFYGIKKKLNENTILQWKYIEVQKVFKRKCGIDIDINYYIYQKLKDLKKEVKLFMIISSEDIKKYHFFVVQNDKILYEYGGGMYKRGIYNYESLIDIINAELSSFQKLNGNKIRLYQIENRGDFGVLFEQHIKHLSQYNYEIVVE